MSVSQSRWMKCVSQDGTLRGVGVQASALVREVAEMHGVSGEAACALGEAMVAAILLGSYCKAGERMNLNLRGDGWMKQALVDASPDGTVRGFVVPNDSDGITFTPVQQGPWGQGLISVLRAKGEQGQPPYIGTVPMVTGHLAKDLSYYWYQSEQVPSAVGIRVNMREGVVQEAGGFLVQAMPGASDEELRQIEEHIQSMDSLADQLAREESPIHLLSQIFQSTAFMVLEEKPLRFRCDCSRDRVQRALVLTGVEELKAMLAEDGSASVRCDFCAKSYPFSGDELRALIAASVRT